MKNKFLLVPLISLTFGTLTGCAIKKVNLTYGTYLPQTMESLKASGDMDIFFRTEYYNETFIVATFQKDYSEDCLCWSTFKQVIVNYMNKYHEKVYLFDTQNATAERLKMDQYQDSTPALYLYHGKKQLAKFTYKKSQDKAIFTELNAETMYERIHKYVNKPGLYEVNDEYLSNNLKEMNEANVLFIRGSCSDCTYAIPNVIIPYFEIHELSREILYFNLEDYYSLQISNSSTEEEKAQYQQIKDKYQLSESANQTYGYSRGVVPTIQFYQKGYLKDACVLFNDEISQKDDGSYYISNSFYSEERLTSLRYLSDIENNVLKGMTIKSDEVVTTPSGYTYWSQEKAAVYHTPLLEAYLDFYCK